MTHRPNAGHAARTGPFRRSRPGAVPTSARQGASEPGRRPGLRRPRQLLGEQDPRDRALGPIGRGDDAAAGNGGGWAGSTWWAHDRRGILEVHRLDGRADRNGAGVVRVCGPDPTRPARREQGDGEPSAWARRQAAEAHRSSLRRALVGGRTRRRLFAYIHLCVRSGDGLESEVATRGLGAGSALGFPGHAIQQRRCAGAGRGRLS